MALRKSTSPKGSPNGSVENLNEELEEMNRSLLKEELKKQKKSVQEFTESVLRQTVISGGTKGLFVDLNNTIDRQSPSIDREQQSQRGNVTSTYISDYASIKASKRSKLLNVKFGSNASMRRSIPSFAERELMTAELSPSKKREIEQRNLNTSRITNTSRATNEKKQGFQRLSFAQTSQQEFENDRPFETRNGLNNGSGLDQNSDIDLTDMNVTQEMSKYKVGSELASDDEDDLFEESLMGNMKTAYAMQFKLLTDKHI